MRNNNTSCNYTNDQELSDSDFFEIFPPTEIPIGFFEDELGEDDFDDSMNVSDEIHSNGIIHFRF